MQQRDTLIDATTDRNARRQSKTNPRAASPPLLGIVNNILYHVFKHQSTRPTRKLDPLNGPCRAALSRVRHAAWPCVTTATTPCLSILLSSRLGRPPTPSQASRWRHALFNPVRSQKSPCLLRPPEGREPRRVGLGLGLDEDIAYRRRRRRSRLSQP